MLELSSLTGAGILVKSNHLLSKGEEQSFGIFNLLLPLEPQLRPLPRTFWGHVD